MDYWIEIIVFLLSEKAWIYDEYYYIVGNL